MAIRNLSQIINDAVAFIQSKIPGLSLLPGTVARDVVVESPAQEFSRIWTELDRVERQQLLNDATAYTDEELTNLATSLGINRNFGLAATGTVTFRLASFNTLSGDITISAGTEVTTKANLTTNTVIAFNTTADRTFIAVQSSVYFNPTTGFYEIEVPVQAVSTGTSGNVGAGTITVLTTSVAGSPTVINSSQISGGTDTESNAALLSRIQLKLAGTAMGTPNGILSFIKENPNVVQAILIRPGDPELVRDQYGNAADVVLIGEVAVPVSEIRTFTAGVTEYILGRQPIQAVDTAVQDTIVGVVGGVGFNFIKGTHFKVTVDNTTITRGSTRATTKIVFLGSPFPDLNTPFTVNYSMNSLIEDLQVSMDSDDNKIVGTDILVREAVKVLIRVGAFIKVFPGFTKADVALTAEDNVATLLNSSGLESNIDQSDIIAAIQNTVGVDSVTIPISLEVKRPTDNTFIVTSSVVIGRTEYARPDTAPDAISIV